jgi:predicted nicotinamide N-methyase
LCSLIDHLSQRTLKFGAETIAIGEKAGASIGSRVGDAAIALCEYLAQLPPEECVRDARVLELGSGTGVCSIAFRKLMPQAGVMIVSDRDEQRELIQGNLQRNQLDAEHSRIRFETVDWCNDNCTLVENGNHFHYILISDVVSANREAFEPLIRTLCQLTAPGSKVMGLGLVAVV